MNDCLGWDNNDLLLVVCGKDDDELWVRIYLCKG